MTQFATAAHYEMGANHAEVRQSMKLSRMLALSDGIAVSRPEGRIARKAAEIRDYFFVG
jgi:hypothetical protein